MKNNTKKELAKAVAAHMNKINNDVNIERTAKALMNGMTKHELEKAISNYNA